MINLFHIQQQLKPWSQNVNNIALHKKKKRKNLATWKYSGGERLILVRILHTKGLKSETKVKVCLATRFEPQPNHLIAENCRSMRN